MATQTVTVSAGVPAACSYSNTKKGSVVVTKNTTGGDGTFIFTLSNGVTMTATVTTSTGVGTATFSALAPRTYTVSESPNADFAPLPAARGHAPGRPTAAP